MKDKTLMPYEQLRKEFKAGREKLMKLQGPITKEMIETLQDSREKVEIDMKTRYFEWIREVCILMGKPVTYGSELIPDPSWFACYDDGMTPAEALDEYNTFFAKEVDKEE